MNRHHLNRLLKLANHLRYGKLGHKEFDFNVYNTTGMLASKFDPKGCGTAGCAIGECPIVFSQDWEFAGNYKEPSLKKSHYGPKLSGMDFFAITAYEYSHLFIPMNQNTKLYGGEYLTGKITKDRVSTNIRAFVKLKCKELKILYTSLVNKRK